jgi:hypothetical protein
MVARLLTALRVISGYALGLPATARAGTPAENGAAAGAGQLTLRGRGLPWGSSREVTVAGWVTPNIVGQQLGRLPMPSGAPTPPKPRNAAVLKVLEALEAAMARLTTAHYGREKTVDDDALDEALALASSALRRLKIEQAWPVRKLMALRYPRAEPEKRAWSR